MLFVFLLRVVRHYTPQHRRFLNRREFRMYWRDDIVGVTDVEDKANRDFNSQIVGVMGYKESEPDDENRTYFIINTAGERGEVKKKNLFLIFPMEPEEEEEEATTSTSAQPDDSEEAQAGPSSTNRKEETAESDAAIVSSKKERKIKAPKKVVDFNKKAEPVQYFHTKLLHTYTFCC